MTTLVYFVVGYVLLVTEGLILLYACHASPHGTECTWPELWRQLCYRATRLPRAIARRSSR